MIIFTESINTKEKHHSIAVGEHNKTIKRAKLENNVHVQKHPPEVFFKKKDYLKNFTIFTGKHLCWSLVLVKLPEVL